MAWSGSGLDQASPGGEQGRNSITRLTAIRTATNGPLDGRFGPEREYFGGCEISSLGGSQISESHFRVCSGVGSLRGTAAGGDAEGPATRRMCRPERGSLMKSRRSQVPFEILEPMTAAPFMLAANSLLADRRKRGWQQPHGEAMQVGGALPAPRWRLHRKRLAGYSPAVDAMGQIGARSA
jgi:hypothetical protein